MKLKLFLVLFLTTFTSGILFANSITRNIPDFHTLTVFGNIKITLIQSDSSKIILKSDLYDLAKVTTIVENGHLKVKSAGIGDKNEVSIIIFFNSIVEINLDASANLFKTDTLKATNFHLKAAKGTLMQGVIITDNLTVTVNQGSEVRICGVATILNANANSGGVLHAMNLSVKEANVEAVSGGKINILVTEKITAKAKLGGIISYKGNPKLESIEPLSGGKINKL